MIKNSDFFYIIGALIIQSVLASSAFGQSDMNLIECQEAGCYSSSGQTPDFLGGGTNFTSLNLSFFKKPTTFSKVDFQKLPNVRMSLFQKSESKKAISIDFSSDSKNLPGSNLMVVGDILSDLGIKLNGYTGKPGKSTAQVCSESFLSGFYDLDPSSNPSAMEYGQSRFSEEGKYCELKDLQWLGENRFKCPDGYTQSTEDIVNIALIKEKRKCQTTNNGPVCTRRTVEVDCKQERRIRKTDARASNLASRAMYCCDSGVNPTLYSMPIRYYYLPQNTGWSCDSSQCRDLSSLGDSKNYVTGEYRHIKKIISESEHNKSQDSVCFQASTDSPFDPGTYEFLGRFKEGSGRVYHIFDINTPHDTSSGYYQVVEIPAEALNLNEINKNGLMILFSGEVVRSAPDLTRNGDSRSPFPDNSSITGCFGIGQKSVADYVAEGVVNADEIIGSGYHCLIKAGIRGYPVQAIGQYLSFFHLSSDGIAGKEVRVYINSSLVGCNLNTDDTVYPTPAGTGWGHNSGQNWGYQNMVPSCVQ